MRNTTLFVVVTTLALALVLGTGSTASGPPAEPIVEARQPTAALPATENAADEPVETMETPFILVGNPSPECGDECACYAPGSAGSAPICNAQGLSTRVCLVHTCSGGTCSVTYQEGCYAPGGSPPGPGPGGNPGGPHEA